MKTFKSTSLVFINLIALLILVNHFTTRDIRKEIVIDAPKEKVWSVLMDSESYPEWNPLITKMDINAKTHHIDLIFLDKNKEELSLDFTILSNTTNERLSWGTKGLMRVFIDVEHYYEIESLDNGKTRFIHGETIDGLFSSIVAGVIKWKTGNLYEELNMELRNRVEHNSTKLISHHE